MLALAVAVAREAGELLADRHGRPEIVGTKTSPTDVVTEMDQAAERLIRTRISAERPDDAILGEEGGQTGGDTPVRWIVDPLDGTVNYLYGLPDWAVSIAAEVGGQVVAGTVCVPRRDALYGAVAGGGAWLAVIVRFTERHLATNLTSLTTYPPIGGRLPAPLTFPCPGRSSPPDSAMSVAVASCRVRCLAPSCRG